MEKLLRFLWDEEGPTSVEYAIMLSMVLLLCLVSIRLLVHATYDSINNSSTSIDKAFNP
jgi:pilus assembly protein Flp/PilA